MGHLMLFLYCCLLLVGCLSKSVNSVSEKMKHQKPWVYSSGHALLPEGPAFMGQFTHDNQKIVFLKGGLSQAGQVQLHSLDLQTGKIHRLTFNSGFDMGVIITPKSKMLIYSSSSDEGIENPIFIQSHLGVDSQDNLKDIFGYNYLGKNKRGISEIYMSDLYGRKIQRITHSNGFDGFPTVDLSEKYIVYSSLKNKKINLYRTKYVKNKRRHLRLTNTSMMSLEPKISPNGRVIVWIERDEAQSKLLISSWPLRRLRPTEIVSVGSHISSLNWHPSGNFIMVSVRSFKAKHTRIYALKVDGSCPVLIEDHLASNILPAFDPSGDKIVFSSDRSGQYLLYMTTFKIPSPCPERSFGSIIGSRAGATN